MIPKRIVRTVPDRTLPEVEAWWRAWGELHGGWELVTYRDPLDPRQFPLTADYWQHCTNGAQLAGLVRLEVLWHHGGVYVDSDVEPLRNIEPLLGSEVFAGWEDARCVPDAVIGSEPHHRAIRDCLALACERVAAGEDAWRTGPGVTTEVLPEADGVLLLPPSALYPYHYREPHRRREDFRVTCPRAFMVHHWHGSWLTPEQRAAHGKKPLRVSERQPR